MSMHSRIEEWITNLKDELNKISKLSPEDRLGFVVGIERCMRIINSSSSGFLMWTNQPSLMKLYDKDELKEMYDAFRLLATRILGLNIKYADDLLIKTTKTVDKETTYVV